MDPEVEKVLQAYAIAKTKKIQLPTRMYLDELEALLDVTPARAREIGNSYSYKPVNFELRQSEGLYLGMYNAVMDVGQTTSIANIRDSVKEKGLVEKEIGGLKFKPVKVTARYGRFKPTFVYTREYGAKNLNTNVPNSRLSALEFLIKISKGNKVQGASFTIFNSGRIRFSAGYIDGNSNEPALLARYISENYFPIPRGTDIVVNNITSEIKLGATVDVGLLYSLLDVGKDLAKFDDYSISVTFEPERNRFIAKQKKNSPFLYVSFAKDKKEKFTLLIAQNGSIMLEGVENMREISRVVRRFINVLKETGILKAGNNRKNITISPKPSKLARRADNKPAPEVTRRGTTCPPNRRPVPYSFQGKCPKGPNYYVRPNPQGQPCCYKKPKSSDYIVNKLEARYKRANVKVPNSVRKAFGIGKNTDNKANNVGKSAPTNLRFYYNDTIGKNKKNPVGFKIGSRQCSRYSKVALIDIATRLGMGLPSKVSKPRLCELIAEHVKAKGLNTTNKVSGNRAVNVGKNLPVVGKNNKLRLGDRLCSSYPKKTLVKYAKVLGENVDDSMSKDDICKRIQVAANKMRLPKAFVPTPAAVASASAASSASTAASNLLNMLNGSAGSSASTAASNLLNQLNNNNNSNENFNYFMDFAKKLKNKK
jgi:TATA-box binding protein (TBP) (component of TFIID and TFIIIB)